MIVTIITSFLKWHDLPGLKLKKIEATDEQKFSGDKFD